MSDEAQKKRYEMLCGLTLAICAALLALTSLGAGKYDTDEVVANNEKASAYQWFTSKGIKQNLAEGARDTLVALLAAGMVRPEQEKTIRAMVAAHEKNISRLKKEKNEILQGSARVGKANWVQDIDGKLGIVKGARVWEAEALGFGRAGDAFDFATLFLQLSLVIGALGLMVKNERLKWGFYFSMVVLAVIGSGFSIQAFVRAFSVG